MGLEGPYGLYEAVDYTPARMTEGQDHEVVRSYMSHHLGMSLIAIDNALNDNVMQRRFMKDCDMAAYRELLQERVPVGAPIMRQTERTSRKNSGPSRAPPWCGQGGSLGIWRRSAIWCLMVAGRSWPVTTALPPPGWGTARSPWPISDNTMPRPEYPYFSRERGDLRPDPRAPLYQKGEYSWEFHSAGAAWTFTWEGLATRTTLAVPRRENGELRRVELSWTGEGRLEGELLAYLEPVLCPLADFQSHPRLLPPVSGGRAG